MSALGPVEVAQRRLQPARGRRSRCQVVGKTIGVSRAEKLRALRTSAGVFFFVRSAPASFHTELLGKRIQITFHALRRTPPTAFVKPFIRRGNELLIELQGYGKRHVRGWVRSLHSCSLSHDIDRYRTISLRKRPNWTRNGTIVVRNRPKAPRFPTIFCGPYVAMHILDITCRLSFSFGLKSRVFVCES
jgi:hypothetical protein